MTLQEIAANTLVMLGVFTAVLVAAMRKVPELCEEFSKAVRAVRRTLQDLRHPEPPSATESGPADE